MKLFFFYLSVFLCLATIYGWLINPLLGSTVQFGLGSLHIVLGVINLLRYNSLHTEARRVFKIYGRATLLFGIVTGAAFLGSIQMNEDKDIVLWLLFGLSGISAVIFTWFLWVLKDTEAEKFTLPDDDVLDSDMIL